jgi:phosphatidylglycerol:prolipoprotein diacylglycerol transferase
MHPTLAAWHVGGQPVSIGSYGVCLAAAFLVAIALGVRQARRLGEDGDVILRLCFWLLVTSIVGARLVFVATGAAGVIEACREALRDGHVWWGCTKALHVWEGGLVFYGGLAGAILFARWWLPRQGLHFWRIADLLAPSIALGHFIGRAGCFLAGCCFGRESAALGVRFPPESVAFQQLVFEGRLDAAAPSTPPLHAVQLYESAGELALFVALSWLLPRKRWHGQLIVLYLGAYALLRGLLELLRGDAIRGVVAGVSTSQLLAAVALAMSLFLWRRLRVKPIG